jgi:hypothetical protein
LAIAALAGCSSGGGEAGTQSDQDLTVGPHFPSTCLDLSQVPHITWTTGWAVSPGRPPHITYPRLSFAGHARLVWEPITNLGTEYAAFLAVDPDNGGSPVAIVYVLISEQQAFWNANPSAQWIPTYVGNGPCGGQSGGSGQVCGTWRRMPNPYPDLSCVPVSLIQDAVDYYNDQRSCPPPVFCSQ